MDIATIFIAVAVGVLIGILSGMLGIGGGTVMVPVFRLGFGLPAIGATATSLFAIIPTAISGSITHVRQKTCIPKLGVLAGVGGACLSPVGVWLASVSPGWAIMLAAALVIAYSSYTMFRKALSAPKKDESSPCRPERSERSERSRRTSPASIGNSSRGASGEGAPLATRRFAARNSAEQNSSEIASNRLWLGLPIGAVAGLIAGYVGVGGGFLMVPLFLSVVGIDMKKASGTSLLAIAILSIPGTIEQIILGNVAIALAIAVVLGSVPGATLGARLVKRIPERELRLIFAGVLMVAAVLLVVQELGVF